MKRTVSIVLSIVMILALAVVPALATTPDVTTASSTPADGSIKITLPTTEVAPSAATTYKI